eukprot:149801-Pyramimonas_sp.AAC.1
MIQGIRHMLTCSGISSAPPPAVSKDTREGCRGLEGHFEALAGRGQRKRPRMGRGCNDARLPLGRLPILTTR